MRIFGFIKQSSAAKFILADILEAFIRTNNQVFFIDLDIFCIELKRLPTVEEKYFKLSGLLVKIKEFAPDIIVSYGLEIFSPLFIEIDELLNFNLFSCFKNIPILCFIFDFGYPFDSNINEIEFNNRDSKQTSWYEMQNFNIFYYVWDKNAISIMNNYGIINTDFFPMAVNEKKFFYNPNISRNKNICFVGGPTPERIDIMESISNYGLDIYGYDKTGWAKSDILKNRYMYPVIIQEQLCEIYNQYKFSINATRTHGFMSLNMRIYEAIAAGCVMITDEKSDVYKLFEPDNEILVYTDKNSLCRILDKYLNDVELIKKMREAGLTRVLSEHTYYRRILNIMENISQLIFESAIFSNLFELYEKSEFEKLESEFAKIDCTSIKINKIYYLFFQIVLEKNYTGVSDELKKYITESIKITDKNKRINKIIG